MLLQVVRHKHFGRTAMSAEMEAHQSGISEMYISEETYFSSQTFIGSSRRSTSTRHGSTRRLCTRAFSFT